MKLKNIGSKIISVGSTVLMPGEEKSFPNSAVDTPAVHVLANFGYLEMEEEKKAEEVKETEVKAEEGQTAEEATEALVEQEPAKRTRKKKAE